MSSDLKRLFNNFSNLFLQNFLLNLIFGWCILAPLSLVMLKKRNLILFLSRFNGVFGDNVKYLYLFVSGLKDKNVEHYFLAENKKLLGELGKKGLPAIYYPSLSGLWKLLRAKIIIVDSNEWVTAFKDKAAYRAFKVQLWHGTGIKRVVLDNPDFKGQSSFLHRLYYKIKGTFVKYDLLLLTSAEQQKRRARMFVHKNIIINGQPRNDIILRGNPDINSLFGADVEFIKKISGLKNDGYKIILYTPTWRDTETDTYNMQNLPLDIGSLSRFLRKNRLIFIFKFHPKSTHTLQLQSEQNILEYSSRADVYPLLNLVDILITDYSSIYLDYILLDRPIIFFPYDFKIYTADMKRADPDDYLSLTPGPKCYNYNELEKELAKCIVKIQDDYAGDRARIRNFIYDFPDGFACERIWEYLNKNIINK